MLLIGNYQNISGDDREQKLRERGYSEGQIKVALADNPAESKTVTSLNVRFNTNQAIKYPYFSYVFTLYLRYRDGILPYEGPLTDQPAKIIDMFNILEQLQHETEVKQRKEAEKENKKRGRR